MTAGVRSTTATVDRAFYRHTSMTLVYQMDDHDEKNLIVGYAAVNLKPKLLIIEDCARIIILLELS